MEKMYHVGFDDTHGAKYIILPGDPGRVDGHGSDPFYRLQFLARILKDKVGHGAGGCGHGHVYRHGWPFYCHWCRGML